MITDIITHKRQQEFSEMYHADMFEIGLKYKAYTNLLPEFDNVLREVPCKEGIADFICYKSTPFLNKYSDVILSINREVGKSFIPVISVLLKLEKQSLLDLSLHTGYDIKRLKKIINALEEHTVVKVNVKEQYSLYANWKNFDVDLWAFELKLKNWKRALYQAMQYKVFSSKVYTVFPMYKKDLLQKNIQSFINLNVGCLLQDSDTNELFILYKPVEEELTYGSQYLYALTETIITNRAS